jgi:hypothetical protein
MANIGAGSYLALEKEMISKLTAVTTAAILLALHPLPAVATGLLYDAGCPIERATQAAKSLCINSFILEKHSLGAYYAVSVLHTASEPGHRFEYEEDLIVDCVAGSVWDSEEPVHERQRGNINFQLFRGVYLSNKADVNLYFAVCREEPKKY